MLTVYHGSTQTVDAPICAFGRPRLDFGQGFYWLDFIVANRRGENVAAEYDYIEGGIANDRVIDTVNLYIQGLIDSATALQQLAFYKPNNQICLLNQSLTDKYLHFYGSERI